MKLLIINGPNLNLLGNREVSVYGELSLEQIKKLTREKAKSLSIDFDWFQSNFESEIIQKIHSINNSDFEGLIINPGAFSHTSIGILDALKAVECPVGEVHLSNVYARESYRHKLLTAEAADFIMEGLGEMSYFAAAWYMNNDVSS